MYTNSPNNNVIFYTLPYAFEAPEYKSLGASGMDICAAFERSIAPQEERLVSTGIAAVIPEGLEIQVRPRSGLALKNMVSVLNTPGTVDSDYRGEIGIILINFGSNRFFWKRGDRLAQLVVCPVVRASTSVEKVESLQALPTTARGAGGFGSTGVG